MIRKADKMELLTLKNYLSTKDHPAVTIVELLEIEEKYTFSRTVYVSDFDPTNFVFIAKTFPKMQSFSIYWDTEKLTEDEVKLYLNSIPNWNWNEKFLVCALDINLEEKLHRIFADEKISSSKLTRIHFGPCYTYEIFPEKLEALTSSLPSGFKIDELKQKDLPYVFEKWKYSDEESVSAYEKLIQVLPTSAIYEEDKDSNPIAWAILYSNGFVGMIYTHPDFRNRGLALIVLNNLCKKVQKKGLRLITQVETDNEVSKKFHTKIGAKILGETRWIIYDSIS